jgi:hypothetical protein
MTALHTRLQLPLTYQAPSTFPKAASLHILELPQVIHNKHYNVYTNPWQTTGAIWGSLLPTVIAIAIYFCFSDMLLLGQCLYYNSLTSKQSPASPSSSPIDTPQITIRRPTQDLSTEHDPLITDFERRRSSVASRRSSVALERQRKDSLSSVLKDDANSLSPATREVLSILGVIAAGTVGWALAYYSGAWNVKGDPEGGREMPMGAKMLGYLSAVLYLAARVPQIVKNAREGSCEGMYYVRLC